METQGVDDHHRPWIFRYHRHLGDQQGFGKNHESEDDVRDGDFYRLFR
jgi:hypothetical protein